MLYCSGWLQKSARSIAQLTPINGHGKNGFMSAAGGWTSSETLTLYTPAGNIAATESLMGQWLPCETECTMVTAA